MFVSVTVFPFKETMHSDRFYYMASGGLRVNYPLIMQNFTLQLNPTHRITVTIKSRVNISAHDLYQGTFDTFGSRNTIFPAV